MSNKILFFFVLFITACQAQNNKTLLILKAGREITIDYKKAIAPSSAQYWKENGKEYLIWSSWRDTTIVFTNLENLAHEKIIPVPNPLNRNLFMFEYKGKDSLYLAFNAGDFPNYWHDSSLIRVGEKGQLLETFCFDSLPVFAANNTDYNQNKENASYGQYFYTSSFVGKNKVFMPLSSYRVLNEDSNFNQKNC